VKFVIEYGSRFLPLYNFNIKNGEWSHQDAIQKANISLEIEQVYGSENYLHIQNEEAENLYKQALAEAHKIAMNLPEDVTLLEFEKELNELMYFYVHKVTNYN
ncbi:MAG: hypothetical protein R6V77_02125, partial [Candidatus Cloacimonadaceae bacterium]